MSDEAQLRTRVARACRVLGRLNLTGGTQGHVSARLPGSDHFLIRARGPGELGVRYTTEDEIVEAGMDGKLTRQNDAGLKSPTEVFIHTELYRARPDVGSVIHIHPAKVVLFTICDRPLLPLYGAYHPAGLRLVLDGIPLYDCSTLVKTPQLGGDLVRAMGNAPTCLMRGHGITTAAATIEEAALLAISLNELAVMNYEAAMLGNPRPISLEDQETFRKEAVVARSKELWRYYCRLTDADAL